MLTTDIEEDASLTATGETSRYGEEIKKQCFINYNKAMKAGDFSNSVMSSYHSALREGLKWPSKIFFELLLGQL